MAPVTVPLVDFGNRPNNGMTGVFLVSPRYVVRPDGVHSRTTVVNRRSDNREVLRYTPKRADYDPDFVGISGDVLVLGEEDTAKSEPAKGLASATIFNLVTGRATKTSDAPGAPPLSQYPLQAAVVDDKYIYSASAHGWSSNCVGEIDLGQLRGREVTCTKTPDTLLYVRAAEPGAAWLHLPGGCSTPAATHTASSTGRGTSRSDR